MLSSQITVSQVALLVWASLGSLQVTQALPMPRTVAGRQYSAAEEAAPTSGGVNKWAQANAGVIAVIVVVVLAAGVLYWRYRKRRATKLAQRQNEQQFEESQRRTQQEEDRQKIEETHGVVNLMEILFKAIRRDEK